MLLQNAQLFVHTLTGTSMFQPEYQHTAQPLYKIAATRLC